MSVCVSIITPLYNCSDFLDKTIQSVLSQTYKNWEMILVDDFSTDSSLAIAQSYAAQDDRIKVIRLKENSGAAVARNTAIEAATGRFIAFLDSDDLWLPKKLEKQIYFMLEKNIAFSYTAYFSIDEYDAIQEKMGVPEKIQYKELLKTCVIGCLTVIYDAEKIGKYHMPTSTKREDFATWLNILKKIDFAYGLPEPLAKYRIYDKQSSAKKVKMAKENWLLYRNIEKLDLFQACYYFTHYAIRGILRKKFPKIARLLKIL